MASVTFVENVKVERTTPHGRETNIKKVPVDDFLALLESKPIHTMAELYGEDSIIHPVFDYEEYFCDKPNDDDVKKSLDTCIDNLIKLFSNEINKNDIFISTKVPRFDTKKNQWKISFHFCISGYSIKTSILKKLIIYSDQQDFWDTSIYKKENLLYTIGSAKEDNVPFEPLSGVVSKNYFATSVDGKEHFIDMEEFFNNNNYDFKNKVGLDDDVGGHPSTAKELIKLLRGLGDDSVFVESQTKGNKYYFRKNRRDRKCHCTGETHVSNNFVLIPHGNGDVEYICYAESHNGNNSKIIGRLENYFLFDDETSKNTPLSEHTRFDLHVIRKLNKNWLDVKDAIREVGDKIKEDTKKDGMNIEHLVKGLEKLKVKKQKIYESTLNYLNRFFAIVSSQKMSFIELFFDKKGRLEDYVRRDKSQTADYLANCRWDFGNGKERVPIFSLWFMWEHRKMFDSIYTSPDGKCGDRQLNLYLGLRVDRHYPNWKELDVRMEKINVILRHLREVLCNGNEEVYQWHLKWLKIILILKERTTKVPFSIGGQGLGKSLFWDVFLGQILVGGDDPFRRARGMYTMISDLEDLIGRFNSKVVGRLYVNLNEAATNSGFKVAGKLKTLITERMMRWEQKGLDTLDVPNLLNVAGTTNEHDPVRIDVTDRRYGIFEIPSFNVIINEPNYFNNLVDQIYDVETPAYFMKYLDECVDVDVREYIQAKIPMTAEKIEMMTKSIPSPIRFIISLLRQESECYFNVKVEKTEVFYERDWFRRGYILTDTFFKCYEQWFDDEKFGQFECVRVGKDKFGKELARLFTIKSKKQSGKVSRAIFWKDSGFETEDDLWEFLKTHRFVFGDRLGDVVDIPDFKNSDEASLDLL